MTSGGENICFDPLGSHTRAFITDVRPKLFDGKWKQNVGGGDFLQMFGADGKLLYQKELDPQLHSSGPCMSDAEYSSVTLGGEVHQRLPRDREGPLEAGLEAEPQRRGPRADRYFHSRAFWLRQTRS